MKTRFTRFLATCVSLVAATALFVAPANAGTLTAASFTTNGTGYAATNAVNTRYDWRYTTATSGTTSRVETTVPAGTRSTGVAYLATARTLDGNTASSNIAAANSASGNLDVKIKASTPDWYEGSLRGLVSRNGANSSSANRSWGLQLNGYNGIELNYSDGTNTNTNTWVSQPTGWTAGSDHWIRAIFNASTSTISYYTSNDGSAWTYLDQRSGGTLTNATANNVVVGAINDAGAWGWKGKIFFASVANTINGTTTSPSGCASAGVVACFNPADYTSGTTFVSSSPQSEQWTINRAGTNLPADIASDLSVAELSGLPTGGAASYRKIDAKAVYMLPTPTAVASNTATLLALAGFTNTASAGSYSSTITTFDNAGTPATIDSSTTGTLAFADLNGTSTVGTTVDPTFAFTVASHSGSCNSIAQTAGVTSTSTGVALGRVNAATGSTAAQDLSIGTNANTGFNLLLRTSGPLTAGSNSIANAPGTNTTPAAFPAATTAAFGYTVSGLSRFSSAWAGPETTNRQIATGSTVGTVTNCIAYQVQVTASTPAGTYSTTAIYTAVPSF